MKDNSRVNNSNQNIKNKYLKRLAEVCDYAPTLQLKVNFKLKDWKVLNSSSTLDKGTIININAQGIILDVYENQIRKAKDGVVYFGYLDKQEFSDKVK